MEQGSTTTEAADTGLFAGDAWFDPWLCYRILAQLC